MTYPVDDDDEDMIPLGRRDDDEADEWDDDEALGPDERDADLLDGSWEQRHYAGQVARRDWTAIYVGIALLIVISLVVPGVLILFR